MRSHNNTQQHGLIKPQIMATQSQIITAAAVHYHLAVFTHCTMKAITPVDLACSTVGLHFKITNHKKELSGVCENYTIKT